MAEKGFIFDHRLCVACNSCTASCLLENGFSFKPRQVFSTNYDALLPVSVLNISLACNHCGDAVCMTGCPASAFTRHSETGAVVLDENKCIGCKYCAWNCPYDAPKYIESCGTTAKCHLCYKRLAEEPEPACSSGCPTGALSYGDISGIESHSGFAWFPDKGIEPALRLKGDSYRGSPETVPMKTFSEGNEVKSGLQFSKGEWSLVFFSFLTTLAVAFAGPGRDVTFTGNFTAALGLTVAAAFISLFHLGKPLSAWRSILNPLRSPVTREIIMLILFGAILLVSVAGLFKLNDFVFYTVGVLLLLSVDSVYLRVESRPGSMIHSGQTLFIAVTLASWLTGSVYAYVFIAMVRFITGILWLRADWNNTLLVSVRFVRLAFLIITGFALFLSDNPLSPAVGTVVITGEFIDRILFYADFRPLNIRNSLHTQ